MSHNLKAEQINFFIRSNSAFPSCDRNLLFNCIYAVEIWKQESTLVTALHDYTIFFNVEFGFRFYWLCFAKDINIYINSPGGMVTAGLAIYDTMRFIKPDISTICVGMAASMGAVLLAAGTKGKRYALPNAEIMIHQPLGGFQGQASDIKINADHILAIKDKLNHILADATGQELSVIEKDTDRDNYMTAADAAAYGLVDKVIERSTNA